MLLAGLVGQRQADVADVHADLLQEQSWEIACMIENAKSQRGLQKQRRPYPSENLRAHVLHADID